jgi:hypothetical protein
MNKIANVENVVCSVETMSRHPELYHYTEPAAFEGIVGSHLGCVTALRDILASCRMRFSACDTVSRYCARPVLC